MLSLSNYASSAAWQTGFLFSIDLVTNLTDYGFHVFLGRTLLPGDFAIVQTANAVLLILVTTLAVMQPVLARYVAEAEAKETSTTSAGLSSAHSRVIFQYYFRNSALLGLLLTGVTWLGQRAAAQWLNVPPLAVGLSSSMMLLALLRPVVAGVLQGQQRFVAYGLTRSAYALSRLAAGVILVGLGGGALGAIAALPIGSSLALLGGLGLLGLTIWRPGPALPTRFWRDSLRLSVSAFVAYGAYMSLLNNDLIWVNRAFAPQAAGSYATAVLLRRVLALMPGAAIVIMYPRVVARVAQRRSPDRLLWQTAAVVSAFTLLLTALYFAFGPAIVRLVFGGGYAAAGPLLGWMGLAMLGYGLGSIWMNLYLATRPLPFVLLLAVTAVLQPLLLALRHDTLLQVTAAFALGGWALALGGILLYLFWLRPHLISHSELK